MRTFGSWESSPAAVAFQSPIRRRACLAEKARWVSDEARTGRSPSTADEVADPPERDHRLEPHGVFRIVEQRLQGLHGDRDGAHAQGASRLRPDVGPRGTQGGDQGLGRLGSAAGDRVERPDEVPLRDRVGLRIRQRVRDRGQGLASLLAQGGLGPPPFVERRVVELADLRLDRVGVAAPRAGRDVAGVGHRVDPAELLGLVAPAPQPPVGDVHGPAVVRERQVERAEVADPFRLDELDHVGDLEGRAARARTRRRAPAAWPTRPRSPGLGTARARRPPCRRSPRRASRRRIRPCAGASGRAGRGSRTGSRNGRRRRGA